MDVATSNTQGGVLASIQERLRGFWGTEERRIPGINLALHTLLDTLVYRHWLPRVLPRVDAVITVSQASKVDIVKYLNVPHDRVHVTYEGVNAAYRPVPAAEAAAIAALHGLPEGYILKTLHSMHGMHSLPRSCGEGVPLRLPGSSDVALSAPPPRGR